MSKKFLFICAFSSLYSDFALAEAPLDILKKADEIRNPQSASFRMKARVESSDDVPAVFEVSTGGKDKTMIKTLEPAIDKGRNLLMLGEDMWAYVPSLKRAVRVSLNQKLTGQTANGDISRMRWSGDYDAKLESEDAKSWVLYLTATKKGLTYDKIRAWIEKSSFRPLKAEYLGINGKVLKKATFGEFKEIAKGIRPTEIRIEDALKAKNYSVIKIMELETATFPDSLFNQNSLAN